MQGVFAGLLLWSTSTMFIRISIVLLFKRVFPLPKFVTLCWTVLALNVAYTIATYIAVLLMCRPITYAWEAGHSGRHCGDWKAFYLWHGILNLLYDLIVVSMPMPLIWRLKLPFFDRAILTAIFAMGLVHVFFIPLFELTLTYSEFLQSPSLALFKPTKDQLKILRRISSVSVCWRCWNHS